MSANNIRQAKVSEAAEALILARKTLRKIQSELWEETGSGSSMIITAMDDLSRLITELEHVYEEAGK